VGLRETKIARLPEEKMSKETIYLMKTVIAVALLGILFIILYSTFGGEELLISLFN
jgi:hypothetical protein